MELCLLGMSESVPINSHQPKYELSKDNNNAKVVRGMPSKP